VPYLQRPGTFDWLFAYRSHTRVWPYSLLHLLPIRNGLVIFLQPDCSFPYALTGYS
jgi:hypothetical protein